jgi:3-oxoacyl-[acyl-carrier protein] reductase
VLPRGIHRNVHCGRRTDRQHRLALGLTAYNVSKYGVIGLTEAIAVEGRRHGISAICVSPGAVDTQMLRRANPELRPGLTPGDVAELILALLDSPLAPASGANIPLFSNA